MLRNGYRSALCGRRDSALAETHRWSRRSGKHRTDIRRDRSRTFYGTRSEAEMSTSDRDKPPPARPSITSTVGYGRPPVEHRFKPGQSGNPRGRRKGAKNAATILEEQLFRTIRVRVGNSERRMTVFEAILRRFISSKKRFAETSRAPRSS